MEYFACDQKWIGYTTLAHLVAEKCVIPRDAITGRVQARYTNDANGKMIEATSYTYTDESNASTTRIITDTVTTKRKLDDNGYVTEETTSEVSFLTVNGMSLVRPYEAAVTVDYVYDYTSEVPTLIESYSTDGTVVDYLYAHGRIGAIVSNKNGDDGDDSTTGFKQKYNLSTDKNGTTRFATDREGNVVAKTTYGTWAEVEEVTKLEVSATIDVDITSAYTGYIYNEDQKIWNAGERVYSPEMKHFTSMDPEPGNVYEKMRVNAYVYAGNNPTTYVDPDGRFFREAGEWIGDKISNITDWIGDRVGAAGEWITETASDLLATYDRVICTIRNPQNQIGLKIIIGTIGLAIGVVATAASGGAVLPILSTAFATTAVGGAMGAASYTISSAVSGAFGLESWNEDSYWTAVQMGASDAYMEFGVTSGVVGYTYYKSSSTTVQYTNEVYYQGNTKVDLYDIMKERGIPQTLTDDEISAAKQLELQMNAGKTSYAQHGWSKYINSNKLKKKMFQTTKLWNIFFLF